MAATPKRSAQLKGEKPSFDFTTVNTSKITKKKKKPKAKLAAGLVSTKNYLKKNQEIVVIPQSKTVVYGRESTQNADVNIRPTATIINVFNVFPINMDKKKPPIGII